MSIFNFFQKNKAAKSEALVLAASKTIVKMIPVEKQVNNLRLVGRETDAQKVIHDYFIDIIDEFSNQPDNAELIEHLAKASINLNALGEGKRLLEIIIEKCNGKLTTDLTTIYTALGCILHRLATTGGNASYLEYKKQELRAYKMATEFVAPTKCSSPATREQKAIAHNFTFYCALNMNMEKDAEFHDRKRKELMPERDWDAYAKGQFQKFTGS